jgi:hypothetical protein
LVGALQRSSEAADYTESGLGGCIGCQSTTFKMFAA